MATRLHKVHSLQPAIAAVKGHSIVRHWIRTELILSKIDYLNDQNRDYLTLPSNALLSPHFRQIHRYLKAY